MDYFINWVKEVTIVTILANLAVNMLPGKQYHSYIRLLAGLLYILVTLQPVMSIWGIDTRILWQTVQNEIRLQQESVEDAAMDSWKTKAVSNYEQQLTAIIEDGIRGQGYDVEAVKVTVGEGSNNSSVKVTLRTVPGEDEEEIEVLTQWIAQSFSIEADHISIRTEAKWEP